MVLQIVPHTVFSHLPRGLGHFADSNSIAQNQRTIFHPSQIATILQMFLPSLFVQLFQQCRSSRIDEVLKFGDSMINLHRICKIPMNCQCRRLAACLTTLFRLLRSFCFARIGLNEWQDLVPRLRVGDCFEIHLPRWRLSDLLLSNHQNCQLWARLYQCVFCKEPLVILVLKLTSQRRSFGK